MSEENNPYLLYPDHQMDRRPRYYDGQFLKADDFIDAQRYGIDRRRRHLRATTTPGVVSGLDVTPGVDRVTIAAGAAVDDLGRQIVLVSDEDLTIAADARGRNLTLYFGYAEAPSDEAEGDEGTAGFTRFHELPAIGHVIEGTALPDHAIALAALQVDAEGTVTVDATARARAGLRVPGPTAVTLTTVEADPGRGRLDGALEVIVPPGTEHTPAAPALRVDGHATVTAGLVVGQHDPTGYQGIANDGDDLVVAGRLAAAGPDGSAIYKLGVGYGAPSQGEGTLTARRVAVGRETVDGSYAVDVAGAIHASGQARVDGALSVGGATAIDAALTVTGATTLAAATATRLDVNGPATTDGLRVDGISEVYGNHGVTGNLTVDGMIRAVGRVVDLGAGVSGREGNAGKIGYGTHQADALCIVGAGTTATNRKVTVWAEGTLEVRGPAEFTEAVHAASLATTDDTIVGGELTVDGDALVRRDLDTVGNGTVRGRLVVGQLGAQGYRGVTAATTDLVVAGRVSAAGAGGSEVYGLSVGEAARANQEGSLYVADRIGVRLPANTAPARALDVAGTARFTGDTEVGGALTVDGRVHLDAGADKGIRFPDNAYGGGSDWAGLRYWRPADSGEDTRLEIANGNDAADVIVLKQQNIDVMTLRNGKVGVGVDNPSYKLEVDGGFSTGSARVTGAANIEGALSCSTVWATGKLTALDVIDLGARQQYRNIHAGKIGYNTFDVGQNRLEFVGGGTDNNRRIKMYAEAGIDMTGDLMIRDAPAVVSYQSTTRIAWAYCTGTTINHGDGINLINWWGGGNNYYRVNYHPDFASGTIPAVIVHPIRRYDEEQVYTSVYDANSAYANFRFTSFSRNIGLTSSFVVIAIGKR